MSPEVMKEAKILIGVPGAEGSRFGEFFDYFNNMEKPMGTAITFVRGQSPARNRNLFIQMALDIDCTHIMFIDDDVAFKPDMMMKLFNRNVDVASGVYLKRNFPHEPLIFNYVDEKGYCGYRWLDDGATGLVPIVAAGLGACLIKTWIFKKMEKPWIRLGELEVDHWCDDIGFFNRMRKECPEAKLFADLDVTVGHMSFVTVWPKMIDGTWYTVYNSNGSGEVNIPTCTPAPTAEMPKELRSADFELAKRKAQELKELQNA